MNKTLVSAFAAFLVVFSGVAARADVIITGSPGQSGTVRITHDLIYDVTKAGSLYVINLDALLSAQDGSLSQNIFTTNLVVQINGVTQTFPAAIVDNFGGSIGDVSANDTYIYFSGPMLSRGDMVVVPAQTLYTTFPAGFNPNAFGTFRGRSFLTDNTGLQMSNNISVHFLTFILERANADYAFYASIGQPNRGLGAYYDLMALYYTQLYIELGDPANAEFNFYKYKGLSLRYYYTHLRKPKLGKYFQYTSLAIANKRFWTLRGNPRKGQQLYAKYRKIALAARR